MAQRERVGLFLAAERSLITPGPDEGRTDGQTEPVAWPQPPFITGQNRFLLYYNTVS